MNWQQDVPDLPGLAEVPESPLLTFKTARQRAIEKPPEVKWIIGGLVAAGAVSELDAPQKCGKTTLLAHAIRAKLQGESFLGQRTLSGPVVWLTEESWATLQQPLEEAGLLESDELYILCREDAFGLQWVDIAAQARQVCGMVGANLLIGDTLSSLAGLKGDEENSSGAAMAAMRPVQEIASDGVGILVTRHDRRAGGDVGESGRGSTAFAGAVDLIFRFTRLGGDGRATMRRLEYVGRIRGVPAERIIDLTDTGYRFVGSDADVKLQEARDLLLEFLPDSEDGAVTLPSLWAAGDDSKDRPAGPLVGSGVGKTTLRLAADQLTAAGKVRKREITGRKHVFWCVSGGTGSAGHAVNGAGSGTVAVSVSGGPSPYRDGHTGHRTPALGSADSLEDVADNWTQHDLAAAAMEVEA